MSTEIRNEPDRARYTLWRDGVNVGLADYRISGNDLEIAHTEVDPAFRNQGLGGDLVRLTLDQIRADTDYSVVPLCPFVARWMTENPDYQDLLDRTA